MRKMTYEQEREQDMKESAAIYGQMTRQAPRLAWSSMNTHCSVVKKYAQMIHPLNAVRANAAKCDTFCHSPVSISKPSREADGDLALAPALALDLDLDLENQTWRCLMSR